MKTKHFLLLVLLPVIIISFIAFQQNQNHKVLFEKAKYSMETKGDLKEAITLFDSLIRTYPYEREYAANAQFHIGLCYEKLGNQAAQKAYQDVIKNYADQKDVVKIARQRLSQLILMAENIENSPSSPKFTKINIPTELSWYIKLSPHGKYLAVVSDKKLWKIPMSGNIGPEFSGVPVQLNTEGIEVDHQAGLSWSDNGNWIAFNEFPLNDTLLQKKGFQSIYVVPAEGGKPTKVAENFRAGRIENYWISLSPDGKAIAHSSIENSKQRIYTTKVDEGSPKQLVDIQAREPAFSPDGKWIAYVEDRNFGTGGGNLWIIPAAGGEPKLIAKAGYATSPIWSPDNSMIAFVDDDRKTQINVVKIPKEGKETINVVGIDAPEDTEEFDLLAGWTSDNKMGVRIVKKVEHAIYTLPVQGGVANVVLHDCWAMQPRWSPDGSRIYYATSEIKGSQRAFQLNLASVQSDGGSGTLFAKSQEGKNVWQLGNQGGNRISPDGKNIVSAAWEEFITDLNFPLVNIWKISTDGLEWEKITDKKGHYGDFSPSWSPDGNRIAFVRASLKRTTSGFLDTLNILTINSSGGDEKILATISDKFINSLVWSPDGKLLAYISSEKKSPKTNYINFIDAENGKSKYRWEAPSAGTNIELAWAPDSRRIACNDREGKVIKIMNVEDGNIEDIKTNLGDVKIGHIDWSPDGEKFVFAGTKGGEAEFWFMEDFLPLDKLKGTTQLESANDLEGIAVKQVWAGDDVDNTGSVSSDGKYISFVDWESGDLALRELKTNESWRLTSEANWEDPMHFALNNVISPDCKTIAYSWLNPNHTFALQTVNIQNPSPSILYNEEGEEIYPACWLSENELIVTRYIRESQISEILYFNILDKTLKELKPFERRNWPQISCSPDEQFIAYDFVNDNKGHWDINLFNKDGSEELSLIDHPANDRVLGWVPGRNEFLFISDRSGTQDLWAVPLKEGRPAGPIKRIYSDIGEAKPMGFTNNGDCFYGFSRRNFNANISGFNQETGEFSDQLGQDILGSCIWVKWSPDGHYLAYIKENNDAENYWQLTLQDLHSGEEIELAKNLFSSMSPCWSPDGKSIIVVGRDKNKSQEKEYKGGIYHVDVKTGTAKEILLLSDYEYNSPEDDAFPLSDIEWSSDGKNIYYLFFKDRLVKHELETGKDITLFANPYFNRNVLKLSPDGKDLLFAVYDSDRQKSHLFTLSVDEGVKKEICTSQQSNDFAQALWSTDGKYIFFTEINNGTDFWRVPVDGGVPEKIWHADNRTEVFSISPDGEEIASAIRERTTEVRVIENLVPELEKIYDVVY